jgi:non-specific serine/threonine protein kinase
MAAGLTQEELAHQAGLSAKGLSLLESGKRQTPYRHTVTLLARALGLTAGEAATLEAAVVRVRAPAATDAPAAREEDLPAGVTPLALVPAPPAPRSNLPVQLTSFIGREREQAEIVSLLGRAPLVTLTGAGGCGKSRLGLAVANKLLGESPDGVWLVELAALADPALVPQTVAKVLGLREQPGKPPMELLLSHLYRRCVLLVLDNCEHLAGACAELATALLRSCDQLRVLATSREVLEAAGEVLYQVPSLSVPDLEHLSPSDRLTQYEAVQLFLERAQARRADFALSDRNATAVAEVCTRLDGMPLAIELAAARIGVLPAEAIAARLDDRFRLLTGGPRTALPRHQTLRATLDWSHDLLSLPEQVLLRRLAVFAGGWTLEAAEAVCSAEAVTKEAMLDLLSALVNKSLVQAEDVDGGHRYRLLETVRQYGWERLAADSEVAAARDRHMAWCLALAETAAPHLTGPEQGTWLGRLEAEHDNLRSALGWSIREDGDRRLGLRLAGALWRFWDMRGHYSEGRDWLEAALAAGDQGSTPARALALHGAGSLAWVQGDYGRAVALHEEALALNRTLGDKRGTATSLNGLGSVARVKSQFGQAAALYEEAGALWRSLGDKRGIAGSLGNLGYVAYQQGDHGRAATMYEEALALFRELGESRQIAVLVHNLGLVAYAQAEHGRAALLYEEALVLQRELGDRWFIAQVLTDWGMVAYAQGDYARAARHLEEALALQRELGDQWFIPRSLVYLGRIAHAQGDYGQAAALQQEGVRLSSTIGNRHTVAIGLESLAWIAESYGQPHRAAQLGGAAAALREALGVPLAPDQQAGHDSVIQVIRAALGEEAFAPAWAEGRALPLNEAVALALDDTGAGRI